MLEDAPPTSTTGRGGPAGGRFRVPGDYLYRSWTANQFQAGAWGLFRVAPSGAGGTGFPDTVAVLSVQAGAGGGYDVRGFTTVSPRTRGYAPQVAVAVDGSPAITVPVKDGVWSYHGQGALPRGFVVRSPLGGQAAWGTATLAPAADTAALAAAAPEATAAVTAASQPQAKKPHIRQERKPRQPR